MPGVPVSLQARGSSRERWREKVADAARRAINPEDRFEFEAVNVTIIQFSFDWNEGDLDNIAKPILDGLCGPAFSSDYLVTQLTLRRTELGASVIDIIDPPSQLANAREQAYQNREDFVYLRIEREIDHRRLPWQS